MPSSANPFVYGEIVSATAFANRVVERERLTTDLAAGQKVFLISPRRYGKSSLIRHVMQDLTRQGVLTVEVTVAASSSYVGFLEAYARALVAADTPLHRVRHWAADLLGRVAGDLRVELGGRGRGGFSLSFPAVRTARDTARLAAEVFAMPGRIAKARSQPLAIALDEFQAVSTFNGGSVEQALRSAVQDQREVGYVFAGSEPSLMEQMLTPKRPFYKAGPVMRLARIDPREFAAFIQDRFAATGIATADGFADSLVELGGNVPYDVQRLAHETWDDVRAVKRRQVDHDDLHATLTRLLGEQQTVFEHAWQRLTLTQRAVLRAVVLQEGREVLSADARTRHRLPGTSSVQTALGSLVKQDVLQKENAVYTVTDSLFREWVARQTY